MNLINNSGNSGNYSNPEISRFSLRAQKILSELQHGTLSDFPYPHIIFKRGSDKKLTLSFYKSNDQLVNLWAEVLCLLLESRQPSRLFQLNEKEMENFLRDDNSQMAIDSDTQTHSIPIIQSLKSQVAFSILIDLNFKNKPVLTNEFIDKNRFANEVFLQLAEEFNLIGHLEFVLFEHEFIYFHKKTKEDLEFVEEALELFFSFSLGETIKLVAVKGQYGLKFS